MPLGTSMLEIICDSVFGDDLQQKCHCFHCLQGCENQAMSCPRKELEFIKCVCPFFPSDASKQKVIIFSDIICDRCKLLVLFLLRSQQLQRSEPQLDIEVFHAKDETISPSVSLEKTSYGFLTRNNFGSAKDEMKSLMPYHGSHAILVPFLHTAFIGNRKAFP